MTVFDRYLIRETLKTFAIILGVLLILLAITQFAYVLKRAATGAITQESVGIILGLLCIKYTGLILIPAWFIAILVSLGRLYRDSEMFAVVACGLSPGRTLRPFMCVALPLAIIMFVFSMTINPWASRLEHQQRELAKQSAKATMVEQGRFQDFGSASLFVEQVSDGGLKKVFLTFQREGKEVLITAKRGELLPADKSDERTLVLYEGATYEESPEGEHHITYFAEQRVSQYSPNRLKPVNKPKARSMTELLASGSIKDKAELHWRLSLPIAVLIFTFLALPLAKSPPRKGVWGRLMIGILVYVVFSNLAGLGKANIAKDVWPAELGLWWLHGTCLLFGVWMWRREFGAR